MRGHDGQRGLELLGGRGVAEEAGVVRADVTVDGTVQVCKRSAKAAHLNSSTVVHAVV